MGDKAKGWLSAISLVTGCLVIVLALFIPPQGEIDSSVLIALGQLLVFSATLLGVKDAREQLSRLTGKK